MKMAQIGEIKRMVEVIKRPNKVKYIILIAVIAIVAVIVILLVNDRTENESEVFSYFDEGNYPVTLTESEDGNLVFELDGSNSPDIDWEVKTVAGGLSSETSSEKEEVAEASSIYLQQEDIDGRLRLVVSPISTGYSTVICKKSTELYGMGYQPVKVTISFVVGNHGSSGLSVNMSAIDEDADMQAGATDSEQPYIIEGDSVYFPNGGSWALSPAEDDEKIEIIPGMNSDGYEYYRVISTEEVGEDGDMPSGSVLLTNDGLELEEELTYEGTQEGIKIKKA